MVTSCLYSTNKGISIDEFLYKTKTDSWFEILEKLQMEKISQYNNRYVWQTYIPNHTKHGKVKSFPPRSGTRERVHYLQFYVIECLKLKWEYKIREGNKWASTGKTSGHIVYVKIMCFYHHKLHQNTSSWQSGRI